MCRCVECIHPKMRHNSFSVIEFNAVNIVVSFCAINTLLKGTGIYLPLLKLRYFMNSPRTSSKLFLFSLFVSSTHTHMQIHKQAHTNKQKKIQKKTKQNIKYQNMHVFEVGNQNMQFSSAYLSSHLQTQTKKYIYKDTILTQT